MSPVSFTHGTHSDRGEVFTPLAPWPSVSTHGRVCVDHLVVKTKARAERED